MSFDTIFRLKLPILAAFVLLIFFSAVGLGRLTYNSDTRVFYGEGNEKFASLLKFEETFQPTRKVLFALSSNLPFESDSEKRKALVWLSDRTLALPHAIRVDSIATVSYPHSQAGDIKVETYLEYLCPEDCLAERMAVLDSPMLKRRLVSKDRKVVAVLGVFDVGQESNKALANLAEKVRDIRVEFSGEFPDVQLYATGGIPVSQAYVEAGQRDTSTLFLLSGLIMVLLLWLILGRITAALILLTTALSAVVVAMGIGGWLGVELNSASSTVPIIVLTLVIASSMHLYTHYLRARSTGTEQYQALHAALSANFVPILLTSLTTALSLVSLLLINSPPIQDIGLLSGIGVLFGGVFSLLLAPLLMSLTSDSSVAKVYDLLQKVLNTYAKLLERGYSILAVGICVCIFSVLGLVQLQLDDDFVAYLSERTVERRDTDFSIQHLSGPSHLELHIATEASVFNSEFVRELELLTNELRAMEVVSSAVSLSDVLELLATAFDDERSLSQLSEEELSQYFFVYELGLRAGDSALDLINVEQTETHITVLLSSTSAKAVREFEESVLLLADQYSSFEFIVTGENSPVAYLTVSNMPAIVGTLVTTLAITSVLLAVFFGNWRLGVITLTAISIPLMCGLGAWGWFSDSIGLSGCLVVAIALGVVIDDAIHLVYQQVQARKRGDGPWESTAYSIHRVGVPIVATSLLFVVGLSPLIFSDFGVNVTFASCTVLVLLASLFYDLAVLPRFLAWSAK